MAWMEDSFGPLIRDAGEWAGHRSRVLDEGILEEALLLRSRYDDAAATVWPDGSGERLMLVTWPAYGSTPDPDLVHHTLDTFWSFLRATGRMSSRSASPADLRKEAKRSAPKMAAAYDDPARHSQGRVLADFGRSIGLDLDGAADEAELGLRLQGIQDAWNSLPLEERLRRLPDPSPKGERAREFTRDLGGPGSASDPGTVSATAEEIAAAARDAQSASFVHDCLTLVEWVGDGRPVTSAGLLRPAVARELYQHLDLWPWERGYDAVVYGQDPPPGPEVDALHARIALESWRSAGECFALDRLWYAVDAARFVEIRSTKAIVRRAAPLTDREWAQAGLALGLGLAMRAEARITAPLAVVLVAALDGPRELSALLGDWMDRLPRSIAHVMSDFWRRDFELMLYVFGDTGLWSIDDGRLTLTELGTMFVGPYFDAADDGLIQLQ